MENQQVTSEKLRDQVKDAGNMINRVIGSLNGISKNLQPQNNTNQSANTNQSLRDRIKQRDFVWREEGELPTKIDLRDIKEKVLKNYDVNILDNIDMMDLSTGERYHIEIRNIDGRYVRIPLSKYKEAVLEDNNIKDYTIEIVLDALGKLSGKRNEETEKTAIIIVNYLSIIMYNPRYFVKTYSRIGWDILEKQKIFKYNTIYSNYKFPKLDGLCVDNDLCNAITPIREDDNIKYAWCCNTIELMNYSTINSLLIAAGVSGVIRQLLGYIKENNININIYGASASGKTTLNNFILSIFGEPSKIEGSFIDTDKSMELIRVQRSVLPYILDERMLKMEENGQKDKTKAILGDIFREYEGKVRNRLNGQGKEISGERTCGPIISSSVNSMFDEIKGTADVGQFRRFIEFKISRKDLFINGAMAEGVSDLSINYYGLGIGILVSYILRQMDSVYDDKDKDSNSDYVSDRHKEIKEIVDEKIKKVDSERLQSSSLRFSLIATSYVIFKEALEDFIELVIGEKPSYKDKTDEIIDLLIDNAVAKFDIIKEKSDKPMQDIVQYIRQYKGDFYDLANGDNGWTEDKDGNELSNSSFIGLISEKEDNISIYIKKGYNIKGLLINKEIPTPDEFRNYINEYEGKKGKNNDSYLRAKYTITDDKTIMKYLESNPWIKIEEPTYNKKFYVPSEKRKTGNSSAGNQRVIKISIDLVGYKESLGE